MITDRERFCCVLSNSPMEKADAIVVLCGEDAEARLKVGVQLLAAEAAIFLVLTGGLSQPPRVLDAIAMAPKALGLGIKPDRLVVEPTALNTQEQARAIMDMAHAHQWGRLLLVASPYHQFRAFLTFVKEIADRSAYGREQEVRLINAAASASPDFVWTQPPPGGSFSRLSLLDMEFEKIRDYQSLGHCASYADGLAYLERREGK